MRYNISTTDRVSAFLKGTSAEGESVLLPIEVHNVEYRLDSFRSRAGVTLDGFLLDTNPSKLEVCNIKEVIFNDPATIVIWQDGTKTVVKAYDEEFDKEKGLAMAIIKKLHNNKGNFNDLFRKWI